MISFIVYCLLCFIPPLLPPTPSQVFQAHEHIQFKKEAKKLKSSLHELENLKRVKDHARY